MGMRTYIEPLGLRILKLRLKKINESMVRTKTPISRIAVLLYQSVMKNFREQGTDKKAWKKLSPITIAHRRKGKGRGSAMILQDTGYMKASVTPSTPNDKTAEVGLTGKELIIGRIHQFGYKPRNIPARPFIILRKDYQKKIENVCRKWFFDGVSVNE